MFCSPGFFGTRKIDGHEARINVDFPATIWVHPEGWASHLMLLPNYYFNVFGVIVSFFGAVGWLFYTPHCGIRSVLLDRKYMTFFVVQFVIDVLNLMASLWGCTTSFWGYLTAIGFLNIIFWGGICLSNALKLRYLFAKATAIAGKI